MNYKIVVASCDANSDLFEPFHILMEKYWPDHPEIIYSTESITNPYYKTICKNYPLSSWTRRIKDTIDELDCDYILLMVDDLFLRYKVYSSEIDSLEKYFTGNVAAVNFEATFDKQDKALDKVVMIRNPKGKWKISVLCCLYDKAKLSNIFNMDCSPWEIENIKKEFPYTYLVLKRENILIWRDPKTNWRWGFVRKGKWKKEVQNLFEAEGITVDYTKRGFIE